MGQDLQLRDKHANPWREAITIITGKGNAVNSTDWATKLSRHYPGTLPRNITQEHYPGTLPRNITQEHYPGTLPRNITLEH